MPDAKVKVDMWLWPMIGWNPIILVFWARNGRGYGPRLTPFRQRSAVMPSPPRPSLHRCAETRGEIPPPQRSISVRCRARVIITHTPSARITCETHAMNRREVYCPPSHWLC
jgi:hypothetical protein